MQGGQKFLARGVDEGHTRQVNAVAFHADGQHVLTGSDDGTARLWDLATGEELVRLIDLGRGKDWLAVTHDGLFDGSAGGRQQVAYSLGGGLGVG